MSLVVRLLVFLCVFYCNKVCVVSLVVRLLGFFRVFSTVANGFRLVLIVGFYSVFFPSFSLSDCCFFCSSSSSFLWALSFLLCVFRLFFSLGVFWGFFLFVSLCLFACHVARCIRLVVCACVCSSLLVIVFSAHYFLVYPFPHFCRAPRSRSARVWVPARTVAGTCVEFI